MLTSQLQKHSIPLFLLCSMLCCLCISCVKDPELVEIQDIQFEDLDGDKLLVVITSVLKNPNAVGGTVDGVDADVYFADKKVGTIKDSHQFKLKKRQASAIPFKTRFYMDSLAGYFDQLMEEEEVAVEALSFG